MVTHSFSLSHTHIHARTHTHSLTSHTHTFYHTFSLSLSYTHAHIHTNARARTHMPFFTSYYQLEIICRKLLDLHTFHHRSRCTVYNRAGANLCWALRRINIWASKDGGCRGWSTHIILWMGPCDR